MKNPLHDDELDGLRFVTAKRRSLINQEKQAIPSRWPAWEWAKRLVVNPASFVLSLAGWLIAALIASNSRHVVIIGSLLAVAVAVSLLISVFLRRYWEIVFLCIAGVTAGSVLIWDMSAPDLVGDGDRIVAELRRFHQTHRRYPSSLHEADIAPPGTRFGPWQYVQRDDGQQFDLRVGEYSKDLLAVSYSSNFDKWNIDN